MHVKLVGHTGGDMGLQRPSATEQAGLEIFRFPWMRVVKWCQQITRGEYVPVSFRGVSATVSHAGDTAPLPDPQLSLISPCRPVP